VPLDVLELTTAPADLEWLTRIGNLGVVAYAGPAAQTRAIRKALAKRDGEIKPLVTEVIAPERYLLERLVCVDTTAAGGNASLLAGSAGAAGPSAGAGGL
jgi:RHH-type proline utilization regulon transcriptional repressor/proline dehydrogenase/delta 1-pyrroline-5-carboxylate dehydrogenase